MNIGHRIQVADIQDQADIAVTEDCAAVDAGVLDIEIAEESRKRLYNHLLFTQQFIHKQAVGFVCSLHPDQDTVFNVGDFCFNIIQLMYPDDGIEFIQAFDDLIAAGIENNFFLARLDRKSVV